MFYLYYSYLEKPLLEKEKEKIKYTLLRKGLPSVSIYLFNIVKGVYKKSRLKRFKVLGLYNAIYQNYTYKLLKQLLIRGWKLLAFKAILI